MTLVSLAVAANTLYWDPGRILFRNRWPDMPSCAPCTNTPMVRKPSVRTSTWQQSALRKKAICPLAIVQHGESCFSLSGLHMHRLHLLLLLLTFMMFNCLARLLQAHSCFTVVSVAELWEQDKSCFNNIGLDPKLVSKQCSFTKENESPNKKY